MASVVGLTFVALLVTTTICFTALGDTGHQFHRASATPTFGSAYSDFSTGARPNHLSLSRKHEYSRTHSSRETTRKQAALQWEQTKVRVRERGHERRNGEQLEYYGPRVFYVRDNGADPTGKKDSTDALQKTVDEAFQVPDSHKLLPDIPDLGGVEIHLEGGDYLVSKPINFSNRGGGNLRIHGGTIRAADDFPQDHYLIELLSADSRDRRSNSTVGSLRDGSPTTYPFSYEDITLRDLMLDSSFRGGGLLMVDSLRINVDNVYLSHFATDGILLENCHEVYIHDSFFGHFIIRGDDPWEGDVSDVAININGNDNVISDVVIFSGSVGVQLGGQGNILTGVHAYNKAAAFGGIGIYIKRPGYSQTRVLNSYLDYTGIVADDPAQLDISHNFFSGDANVVLRATKENHSVEQVMILDNMFAGTWKGTPIVELDERLGAFAYVERTVVDQNSAYGMNLKATVARATVSGHGRKFMVDMSERLLFQNLIQSVQYSLQVPGSYEFPKHVVRSVSDNRVTIETLTRISGTVTVSVDQSTDIIYSSSVSS